MLLNQVLIFPILSFRNHIVPLLHTGEGNSNLRGIRHGAAHQKEPESSWRFRVSLFLSGKKGSFKAQKKKQNNQSKMKMKEVGT